MNIDNIFIEKETASMQQAQQGIIDPTKKRKKRKLKKEKRKKERKQSEKRRKMENKDACEKDDSDGTLILSAEEFEPTLQSGAQGPLIKKSN